MVAIRRRRLTLVGLFTRYPDKLLTDSMLREAVWGERPVTAHLLHVYIAGCGRSSKKIRPSHGFC